MTHTAGMATLDNYQLTVYQKFAKYFFGQEPTAVYKLCKLHANIRTCWKLYCVWTSTSTVPFITTATIPLLHVNNTGDR